MPFLLSICMAPFHIQCLKIHWMMNALYRIFQSFPTFEVYMQAFSEEHTTYFLILFKIMTLCFCARIKWNLLAKHFIPSKIQLSLSVWNFVNSVLFNQWFEFPNFVYFTANKKIVNVTALRSLGGFFVFYCLHPYRGANIKIGSVTRWN